MNKMQLIARSAKRTDCTINQTSDVLNAVLSVICEEMESGGKVHISGFGTMEIRERLPRKARNPKTGEIISLGARRYIQFTPCRELKERVK